MKYNIGGIQKFSTSDGPGIRTSVFIKGCPLNCKWCHNPELIHNGEQIIYSSNRCIGCRVCEQKCPEHVIVWDKQNGVRIDRQHCSLCKICVENCYSKALRMAADPMTIEEIMELVLQDKEFYTKSGGGVTLSGGEILSHPQFAVRMAEECEKNSISYVIDTSGYGNYNVLFMLAKNAQAILYDMKSIDDKIHLEYTGKSNRLILDNLIKLSSVSDIREKIQMRMPLIANVNDTDDIITETAEFYKKHQLFNVMLIPYHVLGNVKRRGLGEKEYSFAPPDHERIEWIRNMFKQYGIKTYVTGENL